MSGLLLPWNLIQRTGKQFDRDYSKVTPVFVHDLRGFTGKFDSPP